MGTLVRINFRREKSSIALRRVRKLILTSVPIAFAACTSLVPAPAAEVPRAPFDPTPWVDPFIGTGGHGHTFPGATVPFGMVQLSPDTRLDGWDGCSGYHHDDEFIYGFSHTHLSGTGCSDYGDILLMPGVGVAQWNNGADGKPGYRSHFRHANETASPGYYSVLLDDSGVKAELTATTHVGVHRYTFPAGSTSASVLIDLQHRDRVHFTDLWTVGDREVRGMRTSQAWAQDQHVYFVARFSKPFTSSRPQGDDFPPGALARGVMSADAGLLARFEFDVSDGRPLVVNVGISAVDDAGAAKNLDAEMPSFDFDAARSAARASWRSQLAKIEAKGGTDAQRRTFYTALYHCCIAPNVFGDVDGRYRGRDGKIHQADGWTQHTVFSLWDTFRALHPLMTLLEPERTNDWIKTFLAQHREGGALPVWELAANETDCMIGYHAVPVIADAYAKGIRGYDANAALDAMVASANRDVRGLPAYRENGFVPAEAEGESVSKTLEYAYDDWCIAEMARALGRSDVARTFEERAQSWKNLFDPATGFFRPRRNDTWITPFDPAEVNFHLTEANSWQYSLFVPHDVEGLATMHGGRDKLAARLDALFAAPSATKGRDQADISGMIGQYAHGNEPSHHMAWLYDYAGQPWQTQQRVRQILGTLYSDQPDGLCGNEDCGQMSAWYVLSALGIYPVCPGRPEYVLGTPLFPEATLHLPGGRSFTIRRDDGGDYVQSAALDGAPLARAVIGHDAIVRGGELRFVTGVDPSKWGSRPAESPRSGLEGEAIVPSPFAARGDRVFAKTTEIELGCADPNARITYSIDGGATTAAYVGAFRVGVTTDLVAWASRDGRESRRVRARFVRVPNEWSLDVKYPWAAQYAANGERSLIDGLRGGRDFRTGDWQGFQGVDLVATVDFGEERDVAAVRAGFLQETGSWIWLPTEVRFAVSADGHDFRDLGAMKTDVDERSGGAQVLYYQFNAKTKARYVRVIGINRGTCPDWHPGAGHKAWIFADEIEFDFAK